MQAGSTTDLEEKGPRLAAAGVHACLSLCGYIPFPRASLAIPRAHACHDCFRLDFAFMSAATLASHHPQPPKPAAMPSMKAMKKTTAAKKPTMKEKPAKSKPVASKKPAANVAGPPGVMATMGLGPLEPIANTTDPEPGTVTTLPGVEDIGHAWPIGGNLVLRCTNCASSQIFLHRLYSLIHCSVCGQHWLQSYVEDWRHRLAVGVKPPCTATGSSATRPWLEAPLPSASMCLFLKATAACCPGLFHGQDEPSEPHSGKKNGCHEHHSCHTRVSKQTMQACTFRV